MKKEMAILPFPEYFQITDCPHQWPYTTCVSYFNKVIHLWSGAVWDQIIIAPQETEILGTCLLNFTLLDKFVYGKKRTIYRQRKRKAEENMDSCQSITKETPWLNSLSSTSLVNPLILYVSLLELVLDWVRTFALRVTVYLAAIAKGFPKIWISQSFK